MPSETQKTGKECKGGNIWWDDSSIFSKAERQVTESGNPSYPKVKM